MNSVANFSHHVPTGNPALLRNTSFCQYNRSNGRPVRDEMLVENGCNQQSGVPSGTQHYVPNGIKPNVFQSSHTKITSRYLIKSL